MATIRTNQRSFAGGEVTPEYFGQFADPKYQTGLALCENFVVKPHGPIANRAGTKFVREVKDSTKRTRVIPFVYSTTQTMAVEVGAGYFRFHTMAATLMDGANPYEIANPYAEADLFDLHFVQSADVLTITHPNYAPRELRRLGATNWTLTTITFASELSAPTGVTATPTGSGSTSYSYKVTSVGDTGIEESPSSSAATCNNDTTLSATVYNTAAWTTTGAARYNVYKQSNGLYGYIGQTDGTSFRDDNITADVGKTPPIQSNPFNATGDYPGAVSYFEQRRAFAGTINKPENLWMTRSGTESNLSYSLPTKDDDAISFRVAAREANTIRHIAPLTNLILLTSSAEWRVTSINTDALTPSSVSVRPQSYVGASNVQPVIVNNTLLYAAARGGHLRELGYSWQANGYVTGDISLRAPHLFDGYQIADLAYSKSPYPIVWAPSTSGNLIGLTYIPEQNIGALHHHTSATQEETSVFESVCVVAEGDIDAAYFVVKRKIDGAYVRYIEWMGDRSFTDLEDAYFVDCGMTYEGEPVDEILAGLEHLEGETVSILADGAVCPQQTVTDGGLPDKLPAEAGTIHIGLPIRADAQTLPVAFEAQSGGAGQGRQKNVNKVWLRVDRSSGIFVGPSFDKLTEAKQRTTEPYGTPPALKSDEIGIALTPSWAETGAVCIRQSDPLPLTVVSMTPELSIGG